jgi:ubiquinone/menaquinone biosynthesis C-methylase UbiE
MSRTDISAVPENLKARLKESYDAMAETYAARFTKEDDPVRLGYIRHLIEALSADDTKEANVLELGCGTGVPATKFMLQNGEPSFHVTGNDLSTTQIKLARKNLAGFEDRLKLVEGDMLALDFPDATFDVVTGFYSVIHLPREEQTQIMKKIQGWLKPGGYFLANFSAEDMERAEIDNWLKHEKGWMFWSGWGKDGSLKIVKDAGLEVLIGEVLEDVGDSTFLWVLAKKSS